ncbi:cyclic GMP-AMP synthase DncV-like nucleotidyltransferase [Morganella morganii]|uniref:cyclic GMP-AMP synthase DncV-like nucleotidyltransferase n=1 Tax=Morganella morganii TaxID=582 RepID=UPI00189772C9|nr:nucleotidyltransferase [Morganella morganii]
MAYAQSQFETFHRNILFGYDSSQDLRDRRDTLLTDLKNNISDDAPPYTHFTQGSYALDTGIHPLDSNPDMDIGILFDCLPSDYPDPLKLKKFVSDALERHNRTEKIRKPCVTVTYYKDDAPIHHVDLAVYSTDAIGETQLAWGRDSTPREDREWRTSEAQELTKTINGRFNGMDKDQFRRCIRAMKRWRDFKIGHKNTPSIGLTVAAYNWFNVDYDLTDGKPHDLVAIKNLVNTMLSQWIGSRLYVYLPVAPRTDLFERMSETQMKEFKEKLEALRDALDEALDQPDTHEACKILRKQFGDDFPVPEKTDTTKQTSAGVSASGRSA